MLLSLIVGCNDLGDHPPLLQDFSARDTLVQEITDGVILRLDDIRDEYGLGDTLKGKMRLINVSGEPLSLQGGGHPAHAWSVSRVDPPTAQFFDPMLIMPVLWGGTLNPGDTLTFGVQWSLETFIDESFSYTLKAFSGQYRIRVGMEGSPLLMGRQLTKFFSINETGDPISFGLKRRLPLFDSLIVDLVGRNRVGWDQQFAIAEQFPIRLFFRNNGGDTVLTRSYSLPYSTLSLPRHSDNEVFQFRTSRTDTMFSGIHGTHRMWISFQLEDQIYTSSYMFVVIP